MLRNHPKDTPRWMPRKPAISVLTYLPYYDAFGMYHPLTSHISCGFGDVRVIGKMRGDDLSVMQRRWNATAELPPTVQTHDDAIAWAVADLERQWRERYQA